MDQSQPSTTFSGTSPSPAPAPVQFTDPSHLTSEERLILIERYRQRANGGETLSADELRHAINLISADRASAAKERKVEKKALNDQMVAPSLDDL